MKLHFTHPSPSCLIHDRTFPLQKQGDPELLADSQTVLFKAEQRQWWYIKLPSLNCGSNLFPYLVLHTSILVFCQVSPVSKRNVCSLIYFIVVAFYFFSIN